MTHAVDVRRRERVAEQASQERFGPWRIWFDPPPIGVRNCDWHYQHEDADEGCPSWMYGSCASRDECLAEIIDGYEDRAALNAYREGKR